MLSRMFMRIPLSSSLLSLGCMVGVALQAAPVMTIQLPDQWGIVNPEHYDPGILWLAAGSTRDGFTPTLNCAYEETSLSHADYVSAVQRQYPADSWRKLGDFPTSSGTGALLCLDGDADTPSGRTKLLQLILVNDGLATVLTASTLATHWQETLQEMRPIMRSLRIYRSEKEAVEASTWETLSTQAVVWGENGPQLARPEGLKDRLSHAEWALTVAQVARRVAANRQGALNQGKSPSYQSALASEMLSGVIDGEEEALQNQHHGTEESELL